MLELLIEVILIFLIIIWILCLIIFKLALSYTFSNAWSNTVFFVNWKYLKLWILNHSFSHSLCAIIIFFWVLKRRGFNLVFRLARLFRFFFMVLIFKFHFHVSELIYRLNFVFHLNLTFSCFLNFLKFFHNFLLNRNYFVFRLWLIFRIQAHNFVVSLLILFCLYNLKLACLHFGYSWAAMIQIELRLFTLTDFVSIYIDIDLFCSA